MFSSRKEISVVKQTDRSNITRSALLSTGVFALLLLSGCASSITLSEPSLNHPANPKAAAAPEMPMSDTLNVDAVKAPEKQDDDPHAGHQMH
jgi:hypothetical protein